MFTIELKCQTSENISTNGLIIVPSCLTKCISDSVLHLLTNQ